MSKLVLKISMTLDGFVCGPNGEMDWFLKTRSEEGAAWTAEKISQAGAHLVGRKTFDTMASFWPVNKESIAKPMNEIPKIVFSKRGFDPALKTDADNPNAKTWLEARVLTGNLSDELAALKKQNGKDLVAHGGASFAQALVQTGLVDEFWLVRHPVAIGKGIPLFSQIDSPLYLKLVDTKTFAAGTVAQIFLV